MKTSSHCLARLCLTVAALHGVQIASAHNAGLSLESVLGTDILNTYMRRESGQQRQQQKELPDSSAMSIGPGGAMLKEAKGAAKQKLVASHEEAKGLATEAGRESKKDDVSSAVNAGTVLTATRRSDSSQTQFTVPAPSSKPWFFGFWFHIDGRFGTFGKFAASEVQRTLTSWTVPTAKDVTIPEAIQDVQEGVCGLAHDRVIPMADEHWPDSPGWKKIANEILANHLPMANDADDCNKWYKDENQTETVQDELGSGTWPASRVLVPWSEELFTRHSDKAIEELVFSGFAQHRLIKIPSSDVAAPAAAYYAVYLGFAKDWEVKPGFAKLGADAYFSKDKVLLGIQLPDGILYTPNGEQGYGPDEFCADVCPGPWWNRRCERKCKEPKVGWKYAKLAFRGTLNAIVTMIDHLYGLHLVVGNSIVTANVEEVSPTHPLRRLLTPFGFRTEYMNVEAKSVLVNEKGLLHRSTSLSKDGLIHAFNSASSKWTSSSTWTTIPEEFDAQGIDASIKLPLHTDGREYYAVLKGFVNNYLKSFFDYGNNDCGSDTDIQKWYERVGKIMPDQKALPQPLNCENLEKVVTNFMYRVSAEHRLVGTIQAEAADPCFMPWAWKEGELCGLPRSNFLQQVVMCSTGAEQPKIIEDYTHMFDGTWVKNDGTSVSLQKGKELWHALVQNMTDLHDEIDSRNEERSKAGERKFRVFEPRNIETAISI